MSHSAKHGKRRRRKGRGKKQSKGFPLPSEAERAELRRASWRVVDPSDRTARTKGQRLVGRATLAQTLYLKGLGFKGEASRLTKHRASQEIERLLARRQRGEG